MEERLAGRYVLGAELGRGGMARVVAADDRRLHRRVAIKLLPVPADEPSAARDRFVREARAAAAFSHPHAVAVFDAGVADDVLFIVMELVDGETVASSLARRGALAVDEAVRIADEVLQALGAAHRAGIVHRDVKPGNVLLTADGTVKLADFGIAKRFEDRGADVTITGHIVGTPSYLAPEQLAGDRVTPAADIYATGVLLFEMLTGRKPYGGGSPIEIALARHDRPPPDVRELRHDVPASLATAVRTALAEDPADRFASAEAMRTALGAVAVDPAAARALPPPVPVAPTEVLPVAPPRRRRHVWWWLALATAAAMAVAAVALGRDPDPPPTSGGAVTTVAAAPAPTVVATPAPTPQPAAPTVAATVAPPTTAPPPPASLDELVALIGADPARFGAHADQLQRDLARLGTRDGRARARDTERVLARVDSWEQDGSLSPAAAALVRTLLPTPDDGEGEGEGDD